MKYKTQASLTLMSLVAIVLLVSFQNCGLKTGDLTSKEAGKGTTSGTFPYEINVDNIAFMSCLTNTSEGAGQYFSFQMMNRDQVRSGLKLSADFYAKYGTSATNLKAALNKIQNTGELRSWSQTNLQFSLFDKGNLQQAEHLGSYVLTTTVNVSSNLRNFDLHSQLAPGAVLPITVGAGKTQIDFRGLGGYGDGNDQLVTLITKFNNANTADQAGYMLGLNYTLAGNNQDYPRAPYQFGNTIDMGYYGSAFEARFDGNTLNATGLSSIHEFNAETGKTNLSNQVGANERPGSWACNNKYMIVEAGDTNHGCVGTFVDLGASGLSGEYALLRDVLGTQWKALINTSTGTRCVQHKTTGGCYYKQNGANYPIAYYGQACSPNVNETANGNTGTMQCRRYLSICEKTGI